MAIRASALVSGLLFMALCGASPAASARQTVRELRSQCVDAIGVMDRDGPVTFGSGMCLGYLAGIRDMAQVAGLRSVCFPPKTTGEQLVRVYVKWTDDNPQKLHEDAFIGAFIAFGEAFPCANG